MSKSTLLLAFFVLNAVMLSAQIKLPRLLGSNAVLQRDVRLPLRGQAEKNSRVIILVDGYSYGIQADNNGRWEMELPPHAAGGPFEMSFSDGHRTVKLENIYFGDVWVCSGQSNMEWPLREVNNAEAEIAAANDPMIRHFFVDHAASLSPYDELQSGSWTVCSPATAGDFTAVGYFFAKHLREKTGVPIGLIHSSWGGSRIEPWMDAPTLGFEDDLAVEAYLQQKLAGQQTILEGFLRRKFGDQIPMEDHGIQDGKAIWSLANLDDNQWMDMPVPGLWEGNGWEILDGIVWFRKSVTLTADQAAQAATLGLGMIDDSDETWINGVKVGGLQSSYNVIRNYEIPAGTLKAGKNVIAVRVEDTGGGGGLYGDPGLFFLRMGKETIPLSGKWKMKVGKAIARLYETGDNQLPTKLYNAMIHPMQWFPIKGAIWYQGESNANNADDATAYKAQFQKMIQQWRNQWGLGDFPFLYVQLANFHAAEPEPGNNVWPLLRESQSAALSLPNTGQAVTTDIGEANDIHPRNKQDVGYRLALAARRLAYGEKDLVYSGPTFDKMVPDQIKNGKTQQAAIRLQFKNKGAGLLAKGDASGNLRGFAIAGEDRKFVWAKAMIKDNEVLVWSEKITKPVAVRYAWADNPEGANLFNAEGLPASPFRTDKW